MISRPTQTRRRFHTSELPLFEGLIPYRTTAIVPALHHITLLPADTPETTLLELAQAQASANRLNTRLVLHPRLAAVFWPDGRVTRTDTPPRGGALLSNRLALPVDLRQSRELSERQLRLDCIVAHGHKMGGHIMGDSSKGGHRATRRPEWISCEEGGWSVRRTASSDALNVTTGVESALIPPRPSLEW